MTLDRENKEALEHDENQDSVGECTDSVGTSGRWTYFRVAAVATFMGTLDSSIVNVALPTLEREFQADVQTVSWVVQSYLLVSMAFLLIGGRLLDIWSVRSVMGLGFTLFTVGSALCAGSISIFMIIASRAIQALGAAILVGANQGLIVRYFPKSQRGRILGFMAAVVAIGLSTGPPLGGFLIEWLGWRSIFWINIPIGVLVLIRCRTLKGSAPDRKDSAGFDFMGGLLIVLGLSTFFFGLSTSAEEGPMNSRSLFLLGLSIALLVFFLLHEKVHPNPILDVSLFRARYFTQSCAATLMTFFTMISAIILMPFYLEKVLQITPKSVGLIMMTIPCSMLFVAPLGGWLSDKIGVRFPATTGLLIVSYGLYLLSRMDASTPEWNVVMRLVPIGVGMGLFGSPNSNAILSSVPKAQVGSISGLTALLRTTGIALGVAFAVTAFSFFKNQAMNPEDLNMAESFFDERVLYLHRIRPVFILTAGLAALNAMNSLFRGRRP